MKLLANITLLNVLIALGFSTVGVLAPQAILPPGMVATSAATTYALYAFVRALGLAGFAIAAVIRRDARLIRWLATLAGVVQLLDAGVGLYQFDAMKILGPLGIGIAQFWAIWNFKQFPSPNRG